MSTQPSPVAPPPAAPVGAAGQNAATSGGSATSAAVPAVQQNGQARPTGPLPPSGRQRMLRRVKTALGLTKNRVPQRKLPWCLSRLGLVCQFLAQGTIIIVILVLWHVSNVNNGITSVPEIPASFKDTMGARQVLQWSYSLFWTTVPTWLMSLYAAFWGLLLTQLEECQPMVEMLRHHSARTSADANKSTARKTILLDYDRYPPLVNAFKAARNGHFLVGACMLIKAVLFLATGFSAAIFSVASVPANSTIRLTTSMYFNKWAFGVPSDMQINFDSVSANLIGGVAPHAWTTPSHAFLPFDTPPDVLVGNATAATEAYWSQLDCQSIEISSQFVNMSVERSDDENPSTSISFAFRDRGCDVDGEMTIVAKRHRFMQTWRVLNCPPPPDRVDAWDLGDPWRIGIFAGDGDDTSPTFLTNMSLISCIPSFWNASADVTVALSAKSPGEVVSFSTGAAPAKSWPYTINSFVNNLPDYNTYQPVGDPDTALQMDYFARLVYRLATTRARAGDDAFAAGALRDALPAIFNAVVAVFTSTGAFSSGGASVPLAGILSSPQPRLFVVLVPSLVVVGIVAIALLTTAWAAAYAHARRGDLCRHLDLIFGHAILARSSPDVQTFIGEVRKDIAAKRGGDVGDSDLVKHAERSAVLRDWLCWIEVSRVLPSGEEVLEVKMGPRASIAANGSATVGHPVATRPT